MDIKWLFASDIHFPKHDPRMVTLWMDVLKYLKPQAVDLLGDIDDADSTSRWAEGTSRAGTSLEDAGVADTRRFLEDIHSVVPKADKHFHDGNHGWYRHVKFLDKNAPQVLDYITPDTLYEYNKSKFEWHLYDQPPVKRYGDIYAHHGEAISMHSGESVKKDVHSFGVSMIRGHCFSADTEILSDRGWLGYQEVSVGDTVYTMNQASGLGEWQQVTEKFVYSDFTEMVSIQTPSVDLLVTRGHGLIDMSDGKPRSFAAEEMLHSDETYMFPQGAVTVDSASGDHDWSFAKVDHWAAEVVEYSGDVWCVTVPNHTVVVRRNGKSVVTMNSHRQGEYHVAYPLAGRELRGFEIGHMCDPKQMTYDTAPNWQAGFAYGLVHGDDVFIDTVEIKNYACYVAGKLFKG